MLSVDKLFAFVLHAITVLDAFCKGEHHNDIENAFSRDRKNRSKSQQLVKRGRLVCNYCDEIIIQFEAKVNPHDSGLQKHQSNHRKEEDVDLAFYAVKCAVELSKQLDVLPKSENV